MPALAPDRWRAIDPRGTDVISGVSVAFSFALFFYARKTNRDPKFVLDLGLVFLVLNSLALGLVIHWEAVPEGTPVTPLITWIGAIILMFAAIVPNSPSKVLIAGLVSASMNPLGSMVAELRGVGNFSLSGALAQHYPDFLLVGVAVLISRVMTRLGQQVSKAREMGSYELLSKIGSGGMGEVWRARHRMLARDAAIKLIQPEMLSNQSGGIFVQLDQQSSASSDKLFNDPRPIEGGWKGLANLLEALTPSVDTEIPLTASQITDRISTMIDNGEYQEALNVIEKRTQQYAAGHSLGTDVQLMFLRGRALAGLGRHDEAIDLYRDMTTQYPELPEPWNNLAAEYVKQGKLEMAQDALTMALSANPNYGTAKANLGEVQLMLARQSFQSAAQLGVSGSQSKANAATDLLQK